MHWFPAFFWWDKEWTDGWCGCRRIKSGGKTKGKSGFNYWLRRRKAAVWDYNCVSCASGWRRRDSGLSDLKEADWEKSGTWRWFIFGTGVSGCLFISGWERAHFIRLSVKEKYKTSKSGRISGGDEEKESHPLWNRASIRQRTDIWIRWNRQSRCNFDSCEYMGTCGDSCPHNGRFYWSADACSVDGWICG